MAKYRLLSTSSFKKDLKKYLKDPSTMLKIEGVLTILSESGAKGIPENMRPHLLKGKFAGNWECHVKPDMLLIWLQFDEQVRTVKLLRLGSHSELFKK